MVPVQSDILGKLRNSAHRAQVHGGEQTQASRVRQQSQNRGVAIRVGLGQGQLGQGLKKGRHVFDRNPASCRGQSPCWAERNWPLNWPKVARQAAA